MSEEPHLGAVAEVRYIIRCCSCGHRLPGWDTEPDTGDNLCTECEEMY